MKVKSHHTLSTSRSASPPLYSQQPLILDQELSNLPNSSNLNDQAIGRLTPGNPTMLASLNTGHFVAPNNPNSSQIWTRSAVRAAQLQKQNDISPCHRHQKHNGQNQHAIGKIVKPIPVRPMSSSSSSSSTHSSQFSSNFHSKSTHGHLSSYNNATDSVVSAKFDAGQNFSLIAKYFASFPATRLAKTNSQIFSESASHSPLPKSTPFLPFKKANTINSSHTGYSGSENIQSTFVLRSQTNALTNTDHLCTNFRRMIKLNEPESSFFNNIRNTSPAATGSANTCEIAYPNGNFINQLIKSTTLNNNEQHGITSFNQHNFQISLNNQEALSSCFSTHQANDPNVSNQQFDQLNDDDATTRLGQITMETRSTRKFLIKHHPYLQHTSHSAHYVPSLSSKQFSQRPSINLMKKLKSKSSIHENQINDMTDYIHASSNNRSGRSSRSNNSGLNETVITVNPDHNLLKFTDSLPTTGNNTTLKRRQLKSLTTASALCSEINQSKRLITRSRVNKSFNRHPSEANTNDSGAGDENCYCDYDDYGEQVHDESCEDYCCDEQEEDSSGYYSSYHSVDLVSSSGGSCVGGNQVLNRQLKTGDWDSSDILDVTNKSAHSNTNNTSNSSNTNNNSTNGGSGNNLVPQHHYQTRYLTHCLEQKQESKNYSSQNNSNISNSVKNIIQTSNATSTPTTRLRYQQQLAAQAASAKFACDLDLDQIEND